MSSCRILGPSSIVALFVVIGAARTPAHALDTAFTYQGYLQQEGVPVTDTCDFEFGLYPVASGGTAIGPLSRTLVVDDGLFTVHLDYGAVPFQGDDRWLEVRTRCPSGSGTFTTLAPRQRVTATPYALFAPAAGSVPWSGLSGVPAGFADGSDDGPTYTAGSGLLLSGNQFTLDTSVAQARVTGTCPDGSSIQSISSTGSVTCEADTDSGGDITAVTAGTGLSGGGSSGAVALAVTFGGSGSAIAAARSDHGHFGAYWGGSGSLGLEIRNSLGTALHAESTAATGPVHGLRGRCDSDQGTGTSGEATAASGRTTGVYGEAASTDGTGVSGLATATTGDAVGVRGVSRSTGGTGVTGSATAGSGSAIGVSGVTSSTQGMGVYGGASAASGETYGVVGISSSTDGTGVWGRAAAASDRTVGVRGESGSGVGVVGTSAPGAEPVPGHPTGVLGYSGDADGVGVEGRATVGILGVSTTALGAGVIGANSATSGDTIGVGGTAVSTSGIGVSGNTFATTGQTIGVSGRSVSTSGTGVSGKATATTGIGVGVSGESAAAGGVGGTFRNVSAGNGVGLYAIGSGTGADIVLGGTADTTTGDDGIISSSPAYASSDIILVSNDGIRVELDNDGDGEDADFEIIDRTGNKIFNVDESGTVSADGTFNPGGADFAELLPAMAGLEPGDVLVIGTDGRLARSTTAYQRTVAGVYSTRPGILGGRGMNDDEPGVPLAVLGVVPVKASGENGMIRPGDFLTTAATPGHAMRCAADTGCAGAIVGKALGALAEGTGVVQMLVMLQ